MRSILAVALASLLAGCTADARFADEAAPNVDGLVVRWDGHTLMFEPGSGHRDDIVREALGVLADVAHHHRREMLAEDDDAIRNGTENVELTFAPPLRELPDHDLGDGSVATALVILRQADAQLLDGNVLLCDGEGCGEYTSDNDLGELRREVERAWSEAYPTG